MAIIGRPIREAITNVLNKGRRAPTTGGGALGIPVNTVIPTISGVAVVGQTFTLGVGSWTNSPTSYVYQWQTSPNGTSWSDISGATATTYLLVTGNANNYIRAGVRAANATGPAVAYAYSVASSQIAAGVPVNTVAPTLSGSAVVGQTLTCGTGTWTNSPSSYAYKWQQSVDASFWTDISGATASTYLLPESLVGLYVRGGVRASNAVGPALDYAYSAGAAATSPVATASNPGYPLFDAQYGGGPTHTFQNRLAKVPWDNPGGDWNGAGEVQQGSTPYATTTDTLLTANHLITFNVTTLVQFIQTNDKLCEFMVRTSGSRYFAARNHPTTTIRPTINVTYTDSTTATLQCLGDGYLSASTAYSPSTVTENICGSSNNVWLRFSSPTKAVSSATLNLYATQSFGGNATINIFRLRNQGEKSIPVTQGIAASYSKDVGISGNSAVIRHFDFQGAESTWKVNAVGNINSRDWFDAADPPTRTDRLPLLEKGKWIAGNFTDSTSNYEVVSDTYTTYGYAPLYPGQKTIHHWLQTDDNPAITWEMFLWPLEPELYLRYYVRFGDNMFDDVDRGDVLYGQPEMNLVGKFGPSFAHRSLAGNGGAFPEGDDGWSMRANFTCISNAADPKHKHIVLGDYVYDVDQYQVDFSWQRGALGTFERNRWYCIERYIKLNTPTLNDGISRAWVDGKLAYEKTNHRWRDNPPYYNGTGPSSERRVYGDMSVASIWWDWWNGGLTLPAKRVDCFIGDVVISRNYVGPMSLTPPVPSWVPAAGDAVSYSGGGSVLTNNWRTISDPSGIGYDTFYSCNVTDYSSMFLHEDWGTHGGMVIWGGGHSATNYNGVTMLNFTQSTMSFSCVQTGTPWTQGFNPPNKGDNRGEYNSFGEATVGPAGRLASPHSYGSGDVVAGKFIQYYLMAAGDLGLKDGASVQSLDLTNQSTAATARQFVRLSTTAAWSFPGSSAPQFSRYVPAQNRTYVFHHAAQNNPWWFDFNTNTCVVGTGVAIGINESTVDTGGLILAESRDLLIAGIRTASGTLKLNYMNVAAGVNQPTLGGTANLSQTLTVPDNWGAICWCSDSQRILIFGVTGNTNRVYEITIPTTLTSTWTVDSHVLPGGKTIVSTNFAVYGKSCDYNPKTKSVVFLASNPTGSPHLARSGNDVVQVYRPRNT